PQVMGIRVAGHDEFTVVADAAAGPVSDLRFSLDTLALGPGEEQRLLVQGRDDFGNLIENLALEWESSNPGVARVDDNGLVTSTSRGTARVRASMRDRLRKRKTKDSTTVVVAADPQPVTDLQVSDAGESWLTTTFTEVDDGTGRPARYEARIAGPDTGWNDAVEVSEGSCQSPLNGTAIGASRSCTITGLDDESTHTIFVRSYRKRGQAIIQSITPGSAVGTTLARPGGPVSVSPEAGTGQSGTVGQTLLSPVRVRVLNESGGPVSGAQVSFSVTDGGTVSAQVADTDAEGIAEVQWTLGSEAGVQTLSASLQSGAQGTSGMAAVAAPEPITIPASALPGPVATVTLTPDSLSMDAGQTGMFSIAAFDAFGNPTLATMTTWTSDDAQVASVASNGEVTAQGVGRTTVRADVDGVPTGGSVTVTGPAPADPDPSAITDLRVVATTESAVIIEFTEVDDGLGGVALAELRYAFSPMGWSWGSASVVLEGECGSPIEGQSVGATRQCTVEGLQAGTAYDFQMVSWRVTSDGNLYSPLSSIATGTTVATEQPVEVAEVRSSPSSIVIHDLGGTYGLVGVALDGAGQVVSTPIQWSTTDADVATVDEDGLVMARGAGTAFIVATAMCCSVADTTAVTVPAQEAPQLASITVQPGSLTFDQIGQSQTLTAVARDASGQTVSTTVSWSSTDPGIASVDGSGTVTAHAVGSVSITAAASGVQGQAQVTVNGAQAPQVASISVSPSTVTLDQIGQSYSLAAIARDAAGQRVSTTVDWSSSDPSIASVSSSGTVLAHAEGSVTITAAATCCNVQGQGQVVVQLPTTPPNSLYPNQPSGMTTILQVDGTDASMPGWHERWSGWDTNVTSVADASNPLGSGRSLQFDYAVGSRSAGNAQIITFPNGPVREMYIMYRIYYAPNWERIGHKNFYWGAQTSDRPNPGNSPTQFYVTHEGNGSSKITQQNVGSVNAFWTGDIWSGKLGRWVDVEIHAIAESTPGAGDGQVFYYHDGVLLGSNQAFSWGASAFDGFQWYATRNTPNTRATWFRVGELLISGR
ncbi:MAG: Ig-like domain-containing protein, partial [Gemmatimonadetes bacterium]|nr:Ig-like domain-containing protein [Gemmatimonadota bacterium]